MEVAARQQDSDTEFRKAERYWKIRNGKCPSLNDVIQGFDGDSCEELKAIAIGDVRGAFYIPKLLTENEQIDLTKECLCEYPDPSLKHDSNLSVDKRQSKMLNDPPDTILHNKTLRWITTGYHYDWTNKTYDRSLHSLMPPLIKQTAQRKTASLVSKNIIPDIPIDYQTSIINYYNTKNTLMGHTDTYESESVMSRPLLSISLGRSAVFLLGGLTKDVQPVPILLKSGDGIILIGEARRCYHGLPLILPDSCPNYLSKSIPHISDHRINLSIRQVFLDDDDDDDETINLIASDIKRIKQDESIL